MDLETMVDKNNNMVPISASIYDGSAPLRRQAGVNFNSFYLSDYVDSDDLLKNALSSLLKRKYNNHKVYIHNLSNFDANFLFKIMVNLGVITLRSCAANY